MNRLDFLKLMQNGLEGMTKSDLEEIVCSLRKEGKSLKEREMSPDEESAIFDFLHDMFFNLSKQIVRRRERIVRLAKERYASPEMQSRYCLHILKKEFARWRRERVAREIYREKYNVFRQVVTHLNRLRDDEQILRDRRQLHLSVSDNYT